MERIENSLFIAAIVALGLSLLTAVFSMLANRGTDNSQTGGNKVPFWSSEIPVNLLLITAFLLLAVSIIIRIVITGHGPFSNMYEFAVIFSWGMMGAAYYFQKRYHISAVRNITVLIAMLLLIFASTLSSRPAPLVPALQQSVLLSVHVASAMIAYAALTVGFAASLMYLILSTRHNSDAAKLEIFDRISYHTVTIGFPFLTLTIILGAVWADIAWGRYWGWDPKETASLVTWLVYAGYLHSRVIAHWRGRRSAILLITGFAAILFTFFGNYIFMGLHSYN